MIDTIINRLTKMLLVIILVGAVGLLGWQYVNRAICSDTFRPETCMRVLFIGNSYTFGNHLPGTFAKLAQSGGHTVQTGMLALGGWTLADHVNGHETLDTLKSAKWDLIVLQEQSEIPAFEQPRSQNMYPAARTLVREIEDAGARPIFFLTWAHRDGAPEFGLAGYEAMQQQIEQGYLAIAGELGMPVVPVGRAWWMARKQNSELDFWQDDGSHPNEQGTYLAACVFYATIFRESPVGLKYTAGLPKDVAHTLQMIAADTVLTQPQQWNLP